MSNTQHPSYRGGLATAATGYSELDAQVQLAKKFASNGSFMDAAICWREVIRLRPDLPAAHNNLGSTLRLIERHEDAVLCFRTALRMDPHYPEACNNLGVTLCLLGHQAEGETFLRRAVALRPDYARAHYNLGKALQEQGHAEAAQDCFRTTLRLAPDLAEAHLHLAYAALLQGRMLEGWASFEWRLRLPGAPSRDPAIPVWQGEPTGDRLLLLHAEEGIGDTIQFCRYVPLLAPVARVVLRVQRPLVGLLGALADGVTVIAADDPLPPHDLHRGLLSLPYIFGTTLESIPAQSPYLRADPHDVAYWRHRLAGLEGVCVGLVWAGNPAYSADSQRSIEPDRLAVLADVPGISFISLQVPAGCLPSGLDIHDPTAALHDMADTAALIAALDLVIGVDTAVVHLAGALGKPVWLLNRFDTDWRWLRDRSDSPWYPTLRQFRQARPGDWDGALRQAIEALREELADC